MNKPILTILIALSFVSGYFFHSYFARKETMLKMSRTKENALTNPLLDCELYDYKEPQIIVMKKNIENVIERTKGQYSEISVYFRDLDNGPTFGVNEKNTFAPVSLLKVPVMIAYLKLSETNPQLLEEKIDYSGESSSFNNLPEDKILIKGSSYTIDELIYRMIALSDNASFEILASRIDPKQLKKIHQELGIVYPDQSTPIDYITVKSYAGLFRVLYNATYLNREMSEKALEYLTKSDFHLGIQAGLPKNVKTALKFGIRDLDQNGQMQIHDCGIVYASKKPYLLCVMTKGENKDTLVNLIKSISKAVYEEIQDK